MDDAWRLVPFEHLDDLAELLGGSAPSADELTGGGVDDANVEAVDQHQDGGSGVGPADSDVV
jgi:hypothetical protein